LQVTASATGPISNAINFPVSFKSSGKLGDLDVSLGQTIAAGQVVPKLDTADLQAAVDQAQATLSQQQAAAAKIANGATAQTLDAAQTTVDNAQKTLDATGTSATTTMAAAPVSIP